MSDWFLQRSRAKLGLANILGALDRWIRRRLRDTSEGGLWEIRKSLQQRIKELASLDSPYKNPSMGARIRAKRDHPLDRYLGEEDFRRDIEQEKGDPPTYWGPTYGKLSESEAVEFFIWKHAEHFWDTDYDKLIRAWRREASRVLPVLPKSGSLPSNTNVGRFNNQKGRGSSGATSGATEKKTPKAPYRETEETSPYSLADREIH